MVEELIRRRVVINVGGFDGEGPTGVHRRFKRDMLRFGRVWNFQTVAADPTITPDAVRWDVFVSSADFSVVTEFHHFRWDDVIERYALASPWRRIPLGLVAFCDFLFSGTALRYLRHSWRYALFFGYPIVVLFIILMASTTIGVYLSRSLTLPSAVLPLCFLAFITLIAFADRWLYLSLLFDDWIFARRYILSGPIELQARLHRLSVDLERLLLRDDLDEVVIVGHSLGAAIAIDLVDRWLRARSARSCELAPVTLITLGASILKIGLHPAAQRFRASVANIATAGGTVTWTDFQARSDFMNFHFCNPVTSLGFSATGSPVMRSVSIRNMIAPARYKRVWRNLYIIHCQFVRANDRRAPFDYFMLTCGPLKSAMLSQRREGAMSIFDAEGRLIPPRSIADPDCASLGGTTS